jgi:hypothetical protein
MQMCNSKGFKSVLVEHANSAIYDSSTLGFTAPNSSYQQYYQWLSGAAHSYGMAFGLHGGSDLVENSTYFVSFLDFASTSSCWGGSFCDLYSEFKNSEPGLGVVMGQSVDCLLFPHLAELLRALHAVNKTERASPCCCIRARSS